MKKMFESNFDYDDYGWHRFGLFANQLTSKLNINLLKNEFDLLETNKCRVNYCVHNKHITNTITHLFEQIISTPNHDCGKSLAKAKQFREQGNNYFKDKLYDTSIKWYSYAICFAPFASNRDHMTADDCTELSLAFANRSAALFRTERYQSCLLDIDDALKYEYPRDLRHKLIVRKCECLAALGMTETAKTVLNEFIEILDNNNYNVNNSIAIKRQLKQLYENIESNKNNITLNNDEHNEQSYKTMTANASDDIKLCYNDQKGRHIVSVKDINFGDIIIVEEPFAAILNSNNFEEYCQNCFIELNGRFVPCFNCSEVRFCGENCRETAWSQYHSFECNCVLNFQKEIGIAYIVLRVLFKTGLNNALKLSKDMEKQANNKTHTNQVYSDDYYSVLSLLDHQNNHQFDSMISYTISALFMLYVLQQKSIISYKSDDEEYFNLGSLILKNIQQLSTNLISILKQSISEELNKFGLNAKEQIIGTALYPTAALLNHSCDPNVITFYYGSKLIVRVSKSIKEGEEVNYCYGPNYQGMSRTDRQRKLREQYYFECQCYVCLNKKENLTTALLCPQCNGPVIYNSDHSSECLNCKNNDFDVNKAMSEVNEGNKYVEKGLQFFESENFSDALINLLNADNLLSKNLYRHHQSLCKIKDNLCQCFALMGHFDRAVKYSEQSIDITSAIFGDNSVEMLTEFIKLISLQWEVVDETSNQAQKKDLALNLLDIIKRADDLICKFSVTNGFVNAFQAEIEFLSEKRLAVQQFV